MHDPEFEKEVQHKMEELEFSPSDAVWTRLENDLRKGKRRPVSLLWLFFLLGGILLGAGGAYLVLSHGARPGSSGSSVATGVPPEENASAGLAQQQAAGRSNGISAASGAKDIPMGQPAVGGSQQGGAGLSEQAGAELSQQAGAGPSKQQGGGQSVPAGAVLPGNGMAKEKRSGHENKSIEVQDEPGTGMEGFSDRVGAFPGKTGAGPNGTATGGTDPERSTIRASLIPVAGGFEGGLALRLRLPAPDSRKIMDRVPGKTETSVAAKTSKARLSKKDLWKLGFAGGGGASSLEVQQSIAFVTSAPTPQPASLASQLGQTNSPHDGVPVFNMRPGASYWAGILVQKPLTRRLSLTAGLNLHYYSARLYTGDKVTANDSFPQTSLFFNLSSITPSSRVYPYYPPGNSYAYTNRYYFLEIPVSLQWQLNRGRKTPIFWEGGLSLSRLASANALNYDQHAGSFYKNTATYNPIQYMAFTSLMIGLSWRGNAIQVGPQVQYGLSSMVHENSGSGQHLFYGGLKIAVMPRRW